VAEPAHQLVVELLARTIARMRGFGQHDVAAWTAETKRIKARARLAVGEESEDLEESAS
jgi:hypothetical protein